MSYINHGCQCAACNMRRSREAAAFDKAHKELCDKIERGELDHLVKPATDSGDKNG